MAADAADVLLSQLAVAKSLLLHAVAKLLDVQADAELSQHQLVVAKHLLLADVLTKQELPK